MIADVVAIVGTMVRKNCVYSELCETGAHAIYRILYSGMFSHVIIWYYCQRY